MGTWSNICELEDVSLIHKLSSEYSISIPEEFITFMKFYNGGISHPHPYIYIQELSKGFFVNRILSYDDSVEGVTDELMNVIIQKLSDDKGDSIVGLPFAKTEKGYLLINDNRVLHKDNGGELWEVDSKFNHFLELITN